MAVVHVARVGVFNVDATGSILRKDSPDVSIKQQLTSSIEHLIIEDPLIPNSTGNPSVAEYIRLEAADDFVMSHIDQSTVVTYLRNSSGGYPDSV